MEMCNGIHFSIVLVFIMGNMQSLSGCGQGSHFCMVTTSCMHQVCCFKAHIIVLSCSLCTVLISISQTDQIIYSCLKLVCTQVLRFKLWDYKKTYTLVLKIIIPLHSLQVCLQWCCILSLQF
jgi:hypothetical protein